MSVKTEEMEKLDLTKYFDDDIRSARRFIKANWKL